MTFRSPWTDWILFRQCHAFLQPATEKAVFPAPADEAVHEDDGENADDPANASAGCHAI